ncbi:PfkB family carbohydrate kinase [Variovorax rhizosphaerae]|uniref:PfkB family carbohydrate kinase n=1 Tax=Variovorax rhizosphaerae TaxID=1836200 RepID=A0ABU8WMC6_9BURK
MDTQTERIALRLMDLTSLNDEGARRAAQILLERGAGCVVITLGARGALLHDAHRSLLIPTFNAGAVVDTSGAGDAFNGGFVAALAEGLALPEALRFASAVAGISVTRPGTASSMPSRAEVEALLAASH